MSMTLEQAKALRYGDVLHSDSYKNADGTCQRWRVNGRVKTWKRNPEKVCVPLARGLYQHDHLTEKWLYCIHLESECPMRGKGKPRGFVVKEEVVRIEYKTTEKGDGK